MSLRVCARRSAARAYPCLLGCVILLLTTAARSEETRGIRVSVNTDGAISGSIPGETIEESYDFGVFRALLIAIDTYPEHPHLETPVRDATALKEVLENAYGFHEVKTLYREQATRESILLTLEDYARQLTPRDNLVIFFAGHGQQYFGHLERGDREGFWIPYDGTHAWPTWIDATTLRAMVKRIRAKHVLVISDSCFSGMMNRDPIVVPAVDRQTRVLFEKSSSQLLSSGGLEQVPDDGGEGHSPFASHLLDVLERPPRTYLTARDVAHHVYRVGREEGAAQPEFSPLRGDKRDNGEFVFVRVRDFERSQPVEVVQRPGLPLGCTLPAGVEQILAEPPVGDHAVYGKYLYRVVGERDRGCEMVLVPGGYYKTAPDQPATRVGPFLVDRYEVTNARFHRFIDETGYMIRGLDRACQAEQQPRVYLTLEDARAFAQWAGKRLPGEAEWEFAAGFRPGEGTEALRTYAWGDELDGDFELTRYPPVVGALSIDRSYWGAIGMSAGVHEWCELRTPDHRHGIIRGGSRVRRHRRDRWDADRFALSSREPMIAAHANARLGFRCVLPLRKVN